MNNESRVTRPQFITELTVCGGFSNIYQCFHFPITASKLPPARVKALHMCNFTVPWLLFHSDPIHEKQIKTDIDRGRDSTALAMVPGLEPLLCAPQGTCSAW